MADSNKSPDRCDLVTREEAAKILGQAVTGVVSGDGFCTWLSEGPVFVAALNEYDSKDEARDKLSTDRRRRETEGKTVTTVEGFGESAQRAVSPRSIELSVLDEMRVIELAVAGDEVEPVRYEKPMGSLMRSLIARRPAHRGRANSRLPRSSRH